MTVVLSWEMLTVHVFWYRLTRDLRKDIGSGVGQTQEADMAAFQVWEGKCYCEQ